MPNTNRARNKDHRTRVGRERSARTETRILEAALEVFAEMGPDAPKIDDFVLAANISRGTFYNYFDSVEALLEATSEWTTRELVEAIENALDGIEGPALRYGIGLRLFFAKAASDPVWSRFVARVWKLGGLEFPRRDIEAGLRSRVFRAPSAEVAQDLLIGAVRQALLSIGSGRTHSAYVDQMTELCLQALGTDAKKIAATMKHELPPMTRKTR
jgi:AcrR family transcriptional regulator